MYWMDWVQNMTGHYLTQLTTQRLQMKEAGADVNRGLHRQIAKVLFGHQ
jgi:hypothetical protein